jgi:ATP-dependent Clp protease ATP-binding subunit ClpB
VFNILLQVLDDGRLTDGQGHTVDFTNTIVAMTSNVGSPLIQQISQEGGDEDEMRDAVKEALRTHFLPEFLNRIDDIIVFHPLNRHEIRRIVDLQLELLRRKLDKQEISLTVTEAARNSIAVQGYDPIFGARPLKRIIQQHIQNPLASELLKGEIREGGGVRVDSQNGEFVFERIVPQESVIETVAVE